MITAVAELHIHAGRAAFDANLYNRTMYHCAQGLELTTQAKDVYLQGSYSAGVECWWQPGSGGEQLLEGVEFVDAPFGGGVQVGLHDREVDQSL